MSFSLASDNIAGCHPDILEALIQANIEKIESPYGNDSISVKAKGVLRQLLGVQECDIAFVTTGTAANVLALSSVLKSYEAVIASDTSHIWSDEAGAVEHFSTARIIPVPTAGQKLTIAHIQGALQEFPLDGPPHKVRPKVVSISQTTEFGLVYSPEEIRALAQFVHEKGMLLHVDGARLCNAAVNYQSFNDAIGGKNPDQYVDLLSLGGTKNGALVAEALIFMGRAKGLYSIHLQKQAMQLISKQRFIAAQLQALYGTGLWKLNATRANETAKRIAAILKKYGKENIRFSFPSIDANAIFVSMPERCIEELLKRCSCYVWDRRLNIVRIMTSWSTSDDDIARFEEIAKEVFAFEEVIQN